MLSLQGYCDAYEQALHGVLQGTKLVLATVDVTLKALACKLDGPAQEHFSSQSEQTMLGAVADEYQRLPETALHAVLV